MIQTNVLFGTHFLSFGLYLPIAVTATATSYIYDTVDLNADFGLWNELAKLIKNIITNSPNNPLLGLMF